MTIRLAALLVVLQLANVSPAPSPGSVEGTVQRAGTREPIEDVRIVLISSAPNNDVEPFKSPATWSAVSDAQGRFVLKNVAPGTYRLTYSANGYVRQEYGQRSFPGRGTQINVVAGQATKDIVSELTPTGAVSGTIRDVDKRPLAGVPVQLMRENYDQSGERLLRPNGDVVRTDDRGEFRIYFITPGRYYLNAGTPAGPPGTGDMRPLANEVQETYTYGYFPGVTDLKFALPIDVPPGTTISGTDLTLGKVTGVRVTGRVIDATTTQPPENLKVKLAYRDPGVPWDYDLEYMGRGKATYNKDGTFEFRDVLPGLYGVLATIDIPGQPTPRPPIPLQRIGFVPVQVGSSDLEGIVVTASPGGSISGRLKVEGRDDWASAFQTTNAKLGVRLTPSSNGIKPSIPGIPIPNYAEILPDGTFKVENVVPGEYRIEVAWIRSSFYIKEARFAGTDVLARPFIFNGNEPGNLEIVLGSDVATVEGLVTNNRMAAASGAQVVLVPDKARHRTELFKAVTTDQKGHYSIPNVPPGDYKLYAWEAVELYRWFDPDFLKASEQLASSIHLSESSKQTIDARLIPASTP